MHARCVRLNLLHSCVHKRKIRERSHSEVNVSGWLSEGANGKIVRALTSSLLESVVQAAPGTEMTRVIGGVGPSVNSALSNRLSRPRQRSVCRLRCT